MIRLSMYRWYGTFIFALAMIVSINKSPVLAQYFTIEHFHSEITIIENGSCIVEETIELTFERERHGIYREVPYRYIDELGKKSRTPITVISVRNDAGGNWKYKVSRKGGFINIRIGDPDRYVTGRQVYVISYRVENAVLFFDDHDELYWNVTGNAWKAPIRECSAEIILATDKKSRNLTARCYTGRYGSNLSDCEWALYEDRAAFTCQSYLETGEGFTVAVGWDKGVVTAPTGWQKFWWAANPRYNWVYLMPPIVLVFMIRRWHSKGRDPKVREAVAVRYKPPKYNGRPLSPGEAGTLVDERMDRRDITASVISLAVKGFIKIQEVEIEGLISLFDKTDYRLIKIKDADNSASAFEKELLKGIFAGSGAQVMVSKLKNKFYKKLPGLKKTAFKQLMDKKYFLASPLKIQRKYVLIGLVIIFFGGFFSFLFFQDAPWKGIIGFGLSGLIVLFFARAMPIKTRAGSLAYMEILGFQEFMNRADKDRLERMGEKELFYEYLPYAIALDVVDHWADAFKDIFQEPPGWYVSPRGFRNFNTASFSQSLNTITTSLGSAMYSAPRSSGSGTGGGGFSGGGGGGGGGGSW